MTQQTAILTLHLGYPSAYTLGLSSATPSDPVPEQLDLLNEGLIVLQSGGRSGWTPTIAAPKSGVWADSATQEGRTLLAMPVGNAVEEFSLVASNRATAYDALTVLNRYGQRARDFWAGMGQDPVYLEWRAVGAPGSQYALIYSIDTAFESFEPLIDGENVQTVTIAVSLEREPAWRGIPPGVSPKIWQLEANGLSPTGSASPSGTQYNHTHISLSAAYSPPYVATKTGALVLGDQLGIGGDANRIDIPASSIPGDAPALLAVSGLVGTGGMTTNRIYLSKTTRRDLYPNNNSAGVLSTSRARMSLNAGDASLGAPANVTLTKPIVADGYLSNGSTINRHVVRAVFAAGAAGFANGLIWFVRHSQLGGRYALFMRATATAGSANAVSIQMSINLPGGAFFLTDPVTLDNTTLGYRGGLTYLGEIDIPQSRYVDVDGTGVNDTQDLVLAMIFIKPSASTPTLEIWELVMLPIDEGVVELSRPGNGNMTYFNYDGTGYIGGVREDAGNYSDANAINTVIGSPITLTPNISNRLYFLQNNTSGTFSPTTAQSFYIHVVPRWYGVRDV